ncbi:MAG TPA: hypothetical protein VK982_03845 [Bacteroidales bacterium]|nr:hypothetical protein [Bacteroidales bacterium]
MIQSITKLINYYDLHTILLNICSFNKEDTRTLSNELRLNHIENRISKHNAVRKLVEKM